MVKTFSLTKPRLDLLKSKGVEVLHEPSRLLRLPVDTYLETPCSLKWMRIQHSLRMGAFSYAVSGFYFAAHIGRYCSIGEDVQIGRQDHPMDWMSTSPFQYLTEPLFDVGDDFPEADAYHDYISPLAGKVPSTRLKVTQIGHDVWIGHGAFIRAGVRVANGAIVAANSVVVKDVPPYAVVGGNPAKVIKYRLPEELIERMRRSRWWNYAPWQLKDVPFNDPEAAIRRLHRIRKTEEPYAPEKLRLGDLFSDDDD